MNNPTRRRGIWPILFLALATGPTLWSQRSNAVFYVIEEEVVEPGLASRYEAGVKILAAAMRRSGLARELGWLTAQRGRSYFYVFQVKSLDELNPRSPVTQRRFREIMQGVGTETAERFSSFTVPSPVREVSMFVLEAVDEFSYQPAHTVVKAPKFLFQEIHRVRHDKIEPYNAVMRRMRDAMREAEYPIGWTAYRSVIGEGRGFFGDGRYYYYIAPFDGPSQIYQEHAFGAALEKALGPEKARQLLEDERQCLEGFEQNEFRLRADMSPDSP